MKAFLITLTVLIASINAFGQNQNVSNGNFFDGEPFLAINPTNSQHMVVAWMGYFPFSNVFIKTKVSFNAGQSWSAVNVLPHTNPNFGSADPSIDFDSSGNVFLTYIDYDTSIDSGAVYTVKSTDGGLNWDTPVEVINAHSDEGQYPIDRPWLSIDRTGGVNDGNIYVTSMPPSVFGPLPPPHHPYFVVSIDGGNSFNPWQYLDTTGWLAGNIIAQPMPTHCVSANGTFHAIYPSFLFAQSNMPQYIIASTSDAGESFAYNNVLFSPTGISESLPKKGYLIRSNPADANHLVFFYLNSTHGDLDVFMVESFNEGVSWNSPVRINDDPIANNRMQDLLWADFDTDGDLVVSWRDRRNGEDSTYTTSSEIWGAFRSADSTSFAPNFQISDSLVAYDDILSFAGNDFMCIKLIDDTLSAVWGDTRNGTLNIWFQRMSMNGTVLSTNQLSSERIPEINIYPNPSVSNIMVEGEGIEKVIILDQHGRVLSVQENRSDKVVVDVSHLSSGVYFVQVTSSVGVVSKRVIIN
jgi:hypothetical protein